MKKIEVVAAIIMKNNEVFATQRGYGEFKGGWEFPGGKIEPGETNEEALIREIKEELDADIKVDKYFCTVKYQYPDFYLTMHCYLCSLKSEVKLLEHEDAKWLSLENIYGVNWLPADVEVINSIISQNYL